MEDNPAASLIARFQELVAQVPDVLQPLIVALAGTIPFIEGEVSSVIGILGGLHPVVAAVAGASGNLLCVVVVVLLGSRIRGAVANRSGKSKPSREPSKGRARLRRLIERFGVPGASLLGPLALPTQLTSATLVAAGVPKGRVILWQAIAIVLWTTAVTVLASGAVNVVA